MLSAFGVEHGEISKGVRLKLVRTPRRPMQGMPGGKPPTRAQKKTAGRGQPNAVQKIPGALNRIGSADISLKNIGSAAGKGVKGAGGFLERHPGLTGTTLVGGGGAAGYSYLSRKEPKRRSS